MTDILTLTGLVATPPKHTNTENGLSITSFRLASNQRRFDRVTQAWVDAGTNWYTVTSFRQLAKNVVLSVQKGQRVVVTGRVRVRDWTTDDKAGTTIEIDADAIGHDLTWGTTTFTRSAIAVVEAKEAAEGLEPVVGENDEAERIDDSERVDTARVDTEEGAAREPEQVTVAAPF